MSNLIEIISSNNIEKNVDENLHVNNIIVKKNNINEQKKYLPYVPTQYWIMQLGERLIS